MAKLDNMFDDLPTHDPANRQTAHRKEEKDAQQAAPAPRPIGRPRVEGRDRLTVKPLKETKQALRRYAFENDATISDVIDALVTQFLDQVKLDK